MPPLPVIKDFYIFGNLLDGFLPCFIASVVNRLVFHRPPEAFHGRIVIAIAPPAHGGYNGKAFKKNLEFRAAVLTAPV